eukprot:6491304-Amphidinium_carterae.2
MCTRSETDKKGSSASRGSTSQGNPAGRKTGTDGKPSNQVPGASGGSRPGSAKSQGSAKGGKPDGKGGSRSGGGGRPNSANRTPGGGRDGKKGKDKPKPSTPRDGAANPARALSAAVDLSTSVEGLLDSGASHVIAPMEELPASAKEGSQKVALTLASGRPTESLILHGEVYAPRVRRVLVPFGKLIRQT